MPHLSALQTDKVRKLFWNDGMMEYWNTGILECWKKSPLFGFTLIIPLFHNSTIPVGLRASTALETV
jgi:hypothetical protein